VTVRDADETARSLAIVEGFFGVAVATPEGFWRCLYTYFDDTTVWENVGVSTTVGREEAIKFAQAFPVNFHQMRVDDLVLSGAGNHVFAERLDHFCKRDGTIILTVRALGVFEVKDGKIARYRDYFDTAGFIAAAQKFGA